MQISYVGPHDEVEIPMPDGRMYACARGEEIDVPADLGHRLLEQPTNWRAVRPLRRKDPEASPADASDEAKKKRTG